MLLCRRPCLLFVQRKERFLLRASPCTPPVQMRNSALRLATRRKLQGNQNVVAIAPIWLYRSILRAHKSLPVPQRILGDTYVKQEFRLHRSMDNPVQIVGFLTQWKEYLDTILMNQWREKRMDPAAIERLEPDKAVQLYELMVAAKNQKSEYGLYDNFADEKRG